MIKFQQEKVVLGQPWGGLGDNLQYSNLPELYYKKGIKFYVSIFNQTRNKNIDQFCWRDNNFSYGKILKKPNIGWKIWIDNLESYKNRKDLNIIQKNNLNHGFEEGNGFPSINIDKKLKHNTIQYNYLADFNAITMVPASSGWNQIQQYIGNTNLSILSFPKVKNLTDAPSFLKSDNDKVLMDSFEDMLEILSKTDTFICLNSGSHSLAAALKNIIGRPNNIICFYAGAKDIKNPDGRFMFHNVEYKIVDGLPRKPVRDRKLELYEKLYLNFF
ncbi:hypothetical protein OBA39_02900 [Acidimicrobiaceae bacterium]|nr:hypothetical protein [Acidimicrobiaceae bacterium]